MSATTVGDGRMVRFNVTTESQPLGFVNVTVGVDVEAVYVIPSIHVWESQAVTTSVPEEAAKIVRSSVTTESQPAAFVSVKVGVDVDAAYVCPSIQVYEPQAVIVAVPEVAVVIVRCSVTTESQPAKLVRVMVGVNVEAEYVVPSIHVYGPQEVTTSVPEVACAIVRCRCTTESQPAAFVSVTVGVDVEAV